MLCQFNLARRVRRRGNLTGNTHQLGQLALHLLHEVFISKHDTRSWVLSSQSLSPQLVAHCVPLVALELALCLLDLGPCAHNRSQEPLILCVDLDRLVFPVDRVESNWSWLELHF